MSKSVCKTQSTSKDYIRLGFKVCISILGMLYSKTKNINNDINSILFIDGWIDKMVELDIGAVFMSLY